MAAYDKNNVFVYPDCKRNLGIEGTAIVAAHMILATEDEGVNSCWINFFVPTKWLTSLDSPKNEEILMLLDLGYAAEDAPMNSMHTKRKDISKAVSYI